MGLNINLGGRTTTNLGPNQKLLFTSIFMVIGLVMTGYGYTQYQGQTESINNAVNITATIGDTDVRIDSSRRGGTDYEAEITFDYNFDGTNYSSNFIYPLDDDKEFNTESEAQNYLEKHPRGEEVDAFVSPEQPGKAFLNAKRSDQPLLLILIGGLMMLIGGYKTIKTLI